MIRMYVYHVGVGPGGRPFVVLTDEDTSISGLKKSEILGTRVHGFAMEVKNESLVRFARSTGGVGVDKF